MAIAGIGASNSQAMPSRLVHEAYVHASLLSRYKKSGEPFWKDRKGAVVLAPK